MAEFEAERDDPSWPRRLQGITQMASRAVGDRLRADGQAAEESYTSDRGKAEGRHELVVLPPIAQCRVPVEAPGPTRRVARD